MVLEKINHPNDIKNLKKEELPLLADEIREFLIRTISESGGHLASNLGVVELTMAMHLVFDLPKDKMIWDVGHQAYTHKLLTGRRENFANLRKFGGMKQVSRNAVRAAVTVLIQDTARPPYRRAWLCGRQEICREKIIP